MIVSHVLAAAAKPDPGPAFHATAAHPLSPTGVFALLVAAFIIDFFAIFPAWLQTRLTFIFVAVGVRQGFDGSSLDNWTVQKAVAFIQWALDQTKDSYIAGARALQILGIAVGILSIYTLGLMLPNISMLSKKLGRFVSPSLKETPIRKMSNMTWLLAIPLGLMAELPNGWVGDLTLWVMGIYSQIGSPIPALAFGVK